MPTLLSAPVLLEGQASGGAPSLGFLSFLQSELIQLAYRYPWVLAAALTIVVALCASILLVALTISAAHRFQVLARPSERGSHSIPTPRLGGLGSAAAFYLTLLFMHRWLINGLPLDRPWLLACVVGGAWALAGGLLDDVADLPPSWKFLFQGAAAASAVFMGLTPPPPLAFLLPTGWVASHPTLTWLSGAAFAIALIIFWMNAYNFMDGMDGQAALFAGMLGVTLAAGLLIAPTYASRDWSVPLPGMMTIIPLAGAAAIMAGAQLGLFFHNHPGRPPGEKTFMGDSGSQFFGFVIAALQLELAWPGPSSPGALIPFGSMAIALSPFAFDVILTIIRRAARGENVLRAHREHLYQRLLIAGWSHAQALALNAALWLCALFLGWAYAIMKWDGYQPWANPALYLMALILALYVTIVTSVERAAIRERSLATR